MTLIKEFRFGSGTWWVVSKLDINQLLSCTNWFQEREVRMSLRQKLSHQKFITEENKDSLAF